MCIRDRLSINKNTFSKPWFETDFSIHILNNLKLNKEKKKEIKFLYRGTNLSNDLIIISEKLKGITSVIEKIEKKQSDFIEKKKSSQPSQIKTCGSTLKKIDKGKKAWELIKKSGCENFQEGNSIISQKHCNFFINNGNANSSDIENLIKKVKKKVYEKTGENLELEIKIIGD